MSSLQGRYDEEVEVYRHHLEQMYKLCRPCQAAVEHYIKHQNRQLRALLLSHQFRRREADQTYTQVRGVSQPRVCAGDPFPEGRPVTGSTSSEPGPSPGAAPSCGATSRPVPQPGVERGGGVPRRTCVICVRGQGFWAAFQSLGTSQHLWGSSSAFIVGALLGTLEIRPREVELFAEGLACGVPGV